MPRRFLVILRHERTVDKESATVPPTTGTAEPIMNLAVFDKVLSEAEETMVPRPRIHEKTVIAPQISQVAKFFTDFAIFSVFIPETEPATVSARYMPIKGAAISSEIFEIIVTVLSMSVRYPIPEETYPEAVIAEEYTGIKPSIKFEHSFIMLAEETITDFAGMRKIYAAERAETEFITVLQCSELSKKLFIKAQIIEAAVIAKTALKGSLILSIRFSAIKDIKSFTDKDNNFSVFILERPRFSKASVVSSDRDLVRL